ncbi:MAG: transglycosylase domain-containing protein [Desulfomonilaceae bacterium]
MAAATKNIFSIGKKIFFVSVGAAACYLAVLLGILVWTFEVKLHRCPVCIYAAPTVVRVGDDIDAIRLQERLTRLGQVETDVVLNHPGQWNRSGSTFNMYLKYCPIQGHGIVSGPVSLALDWNKVRSIRLLRSQEEATQIALEPELLHVTSVDGVAELRRPVSLQDVPPLLIDAIVLTEDPGFFSHPGIDIASTHRAFITNLKAGKYVQGGSTISQQLVKMCILSPEKTLWRKTNELLLALMADAIYRKKTILEHYLNRVYFGQWGPYPLHGVAEASRCLFGKSLQELTVSECALLAATIRAPNVINMHRHPERAKARRNMVLGLLFKAGKISRDAYEEALESPLRTLKPGNAGVKAEAFVELVKERLPSLRVSERQDSAFVVTSLDPLAQNEGDAGLRKLGDMAGKAFLILAAPKTGDIRVFIAPPSKKWNGAGGNLETFLPLTLAPALAKEKNRLPKYTLTSPIRVPDAQPGLMTIRQAFHRGERTLSQQLVQTLGSDVMAEAIRQFGIPASVKGDQVFLDRKVTPLDVLGVYTAMALLGSAPPFRVAEGLTLEATARDDAATASKLKDQTALFLVNYMLKDFSGGDMEGQSGMAPRTPSVYSAADDDGTWFIAYRSDAALLLRTAGRKVSLQEFKKLTTKLLPPMHHVSPDQDSAPDGVVFRRICLASGLLATSTCPHVIKEAFLKGTQPTEWCSMWHETRPIPVKAKQE